MSEGKGASISPTLEKIEIIFKANLDSNHKVRRMSLNTHDKTRRMSLNTHTTNSHTRQRRAVLEGEI